ncbi:MAG: endopeptidase La [Cyanobacteria bacterium]|nr:endopeptidase La [Cyanobacteriota bacterium]
MVSSKLVQQEVADLTTTIFPLIPLRDVVVFPQMVTPLFVSRQRSIAALEQALLRDDRLIVLVAQKDAECEEPGPNDLYKIGTLAEVMQMLKLPDGTVKVLVEGSCRVGLTELIDETALMKVMVAEHKEILREDLETKTLIRVSVEKFEQYVKSTKKINPESLLAVSGIGQPGRLADIIATYLGLEVDERQRCLEIADSHERLEYIGQLLSRELELADLEQQIHDKVRFNLEKTQREYYLREKMKIIQDELDADGESGGEIQEYNQKITKSKIKGVALEKVKKELKRLEKMMPQSAEAAVIRTYLDTMVSLPWAKRSKEKIDIVESEEILDEDHYGLDKVKERIIEYLAVRKLSREPQGTILCLVGPPGVGKTSLARSIARSMNRKFARISLGGVNDEAEIRGHRRTYIGAMPGRIIQAVKQAGTKNPVILLDELEKMTRSYMGDPTAAMLEVLDPDQNDNFTDHYLDAPFSLQEVVFIGTANALDYVPRPLHDRLEVITLSGYTEEEKVSIAQLHVIPKTLKKHGLSDKHLQFQSQSLRKIIQEYTREAGVRNLERAIATICRKVATKIVTGESKTVKVTPQLVRDYLGPAKILRENENRGFQIGISTGLAWTETGGETLSVEVNTMPGKGNLQLTGQLGDVMKESAQAAFTYIKSHAHNLGIDPAVLDKHDVHIHIPEGAIPKDGPSAGVALCTALYSALSRRPVRGNVAMTGEITLRGRILSIGGLKEKVLAAVRAGIKTVLLPIGNEKDLEEIPDYVQDKLELVPVAHLDEVFPIVFKDQLVTSTKNSGNARPTKKSKVSGSKNPKR